MGSVFQADGKAYAIQIGDVYKSLVKWTLQTTESMQLCKMIKFNLVVTSHNFPEASQTYMGETSGE